MGKEKENYQTEFMTLMCIMIWETQTKEVNSLDRLLEVNKDLILDGVVLVALLLIQVQYSIFN